MMKIINVVPYIGDKANGPSYSVPRLCAALADGGASVEMHTLAPTGLLQAPFEIRAYPRHRFPHPDLGRSPEMLAGLKQACREADCIVNHSLWMYPNIYPEQARRGTNCKYVVMPRGTLSAWSLARSRLPKWVSWNLLGQRRALLDCDMLVATAMIEYREIRAFGLRQPVAVIPNGIDIPESTVGKDPVRTMVFLSRIHAKKGVDMLLRCWRLLQDDFPDWQLKIVGPLNDYAEEMRCLAKKLGCARYEFPGELRGEAKSACLAGADCFVLPTFSENFGMAVAEALSCGTPAICCTGAPWEGLVTHDCGWWIERTDEALAGALRDALSSPRERLVQMGQNGRSWMRSDFSWGSVGDRYIRALEWLCRGGNKPDFVYTD